MGFYEHKKKWLMPQSPHAHQLAQAIGEAGLDWGDDKNDLLALCEDVGGAFITYLEAIRGPNVMANTVLYIIDADPDDKDDEDVAVTAGMELRQRLIHNVLALATEYDWKPKAHQERYAGFLIRALCSFWLFENGLPRPEAIGPLADEALGY